MIRKADSVGAGQANVSKSKAKPGVEAPAADALSLLKAKVDHALTNGILSAPEATDLANAIRANPQHKDAITAYVREKLAEHPDATVRERAQKSVGRALGVDPKELFFAQQAQSSTTSAPVNSGLEKTAKKVDEEHDAEAHKKASEARLEKQKAVLESHSGEGAAQRPIGGAKGAAYDAGADARRILAEHVEGKIVGKMGVESRAAYTELRSPVLKTGQAVVDELKRTGTATKLAGVASQIGKPGFKEALSTAAGSVGKDIASATNMTAVNTEAVQAAVQGTHSIVSTLTAAAKGTAFESAVVSSGAKLTAGATQLGAKLGVQTAAGAAEATGQAVPVLGQALGVVTTGLAASEFIGHCRGKPKDWKRIIANGANLVGQAVGIFIPFVGAASTAGKLAADAAMNAHDKKVGKETADVGLKDLNGHIQNASGLASTFLDGAGYGDAAAKMKEYAAKVDAVAQQGVSSTDLAKMDASEREAMFQTLAAAHQELEKAAPEAKGTPAEASATLLGQALAGLMAAFRKSKNVATSADPEGEKKKLDGEAMEAAGKAAVAQTLSAADAPGV